MNRVQTDDFPANTWPTCKPRKCFHIPLLYITRTFKILLFLSNPEKYIYFYRTFIEVFSMTRRIQKFLAPVFFPLHILPLQRILLADSCWTKKELTHARERKNIFTTLSRWNLVGVKPITTCSMTCKNNN